MMESLPNDGIRALSLSALWGYSEEMAICKPGSGLSLGTKYASLGITWIS